MAADWPDCYRVKIFQGERELVQDNKLLGTSIWLAYHPRLRVFLRLRLPSTLTLVCLLTRLLTGHLLIILCYVGRATLGTV